MAEMEIIEQGGDKVKVALKGRLDTEGVEQLETHFNATVCPPAKPALIDFSGVTFMSSMGIRMLISAAKMLSRKGAKLVIFSPQELVRESILSASLDQLIPVASSAEEAVRLAAG